MDSKVGLVSVVVVSCALVACDSSGSLDIASSVAATSAERPARINEAEAPDRPVQSKLMVLKASLFEDMAYADLRSVVLAAGWLPIQDYDCPEKTGGQARICRELAELEACSSDGRCTMWFGHGDSGSMLRVDAFGDYTKWQVSGDAALFNVRAWEFLETGSAGQDATEASASTACPAEDFQSFLQAFAANDSVQRAFTQPLVKVMQYREVGEESETYPSYVRAGDYDGFRFEHDEEGFHVVHADGAVDPTSTPLQVTETADGYAVSYEYGMSEGNSYRFVEQKDCWYLAGDPEPPTP